MKVTPVPFSYQIKYPRGFACVMLLILGLMFVYVLTIYFITMRARI